MNPEFYDFIIFLPRNARFHLSNSPRWYNESAIKTLLYKGLHTLPFSAQPFSKHMAGNQVGNHSTHNTCCMISALCYYPSVSARRHMNLPVRGQCFHGTPGSSKLSSLLPRKRHSWFQMDSNGIFIFASSSSWIIPWQRHTYSMSVYLSIYLHIYPSYPHLPINVIIHLSIPILWRPLFYVKALKICKFLNIQ